MCIVINYIIVNTLLLINSVPSNKWNNSQITQKTREEFSRIASNTIEMIDDFCPTDGWSDWSIFTLQF